VSRWHTHIKLAAAVLMAAPAALLAPDMQTVEQPATTAVEQQPFGFEDVFERAQELAGRPYQPDRPELPQVFREMQYDQYRDIRFRPDRNLWASESLPFQLQFFSRGFLYGDRVTINVVDAQAANMLPFSRDLFDFGKNRVPPDLPADMGFAGFRILHPLNREDYLDEVAVFLGASYFRAIGQNQNYGVSARGLAIDTGLEKPEEFPVFREFWVRKPRPDDTEITVFALLDSQRVTGAYRFVIRPGLQTVVEVKARVLMRERVDKLGIAPLTSMFYHGEVTDRFMDDFRPEVHDSDGLLIESGRGERIWRPAVNPVRLQITPFEVTNPRGFGLLQRDREYGHYQDTEAIYHTRPSVWVETIGMWGKGRVELVEIPSLSERNDNLVAFWTPAQPLEAGKSLDVEYRLHFSLDHEARLLGGRAMATRIGAGGTDVPDHSRRKFVIDFVGQSLKRLDPEAPGIEPVCNASSGEIAHPVAHHNPFTDGWRLFFELIPEAGQSSDLRCFLRRGQDVLTETWVFKWAPN
jgi:periplasmic glucans biosynthesis protein